MMTRPNELGRGPYSDLLVSASLRRDPSAVLGPLVSFIVVHPEIIRIVECFGRKECAPPRPSHDDFIEIRVEYEVLGVVGTVVPHLHVQDAERLPSVCDQLRGVVRPCRFPD